MPSIELHNGENIASTMHKHWFLLFIKVLPFNIIFLLPLVAIYIASSIGISNHNLIILMFFGSIWMLISLMTIFTLWTTYYLDIWIVTNRRIVDIEQKHLFNREVKTLRMETVQDVQTDKVGILQELLNFGTLRVQTAGTGGTDAMIVGIPKPDYERDIIMHQVHVIND